MKTTLKTLFLFTFSVLFIVQAQTQDNTRWHLSDDGSIEWLVKANDSHMDHIEMSGLFMSAIVHYGL